MDLYKCCGSGRFLTGSWRFLTRDLDQTFENLRIRFRILALINFRPIFFVYIFWVEISALKSIPVPTYLWTKKFSNRHSWSICGFYTHQEKLILGSRSGPIRPDPTESGFATLFYMIFMALILTKKSRDGAISQRDCLTGLKMCFDDFTS
jgi:hypothetical protein